MKLVLKIILSVGLYFVVANNSVHAMEGCFSECSNLVDIGNFNKILQPLSVLNDSTDSLESSKVIRKVAKKLNSFCMKKCSDPQGWSCWVKIFNENIKALHLLLEDVELFQKIAQKVELEDLERISKRKDLSDEYYLAPSVLCDLYFRWCFPNLDSFESVKSKKHKDRNGGSNKEECRVHDDSSFGHLPTFEELKKSEASCFNNEKVERNRGGSEEESCGEEEGCGEEDGDAEEVFHGREMCHQNSFCSEDEDFS